MPSWITCRQAFYHRYQGEGESTNQFIAALRSAALYWEFRDLEGALLDRLVCGVRDLWLQCHLLAKMEITLQSALDEARAAELSNQSTAEIQRANNLTPTRKPDTIHHEDLDPEGGIDEDDDIHPLKTANEKTGLVTRQQPKLSVWAVGGITRSQPAS